MAVVVETFHKCQNVNLLVALVENSGYHQSQQNSSSGDHEFQYKMGTHLIITEILKL